MDSFALCPQIQHYHIKTKNWYVSVKFKLWQPLLRYIDFVSITLTVCYSLKNNLEADIQCTFRTLYHCE